MNAKPAMLQQIGGKVEMEKVPLPGVFYGIVLKINI